MAKIKHTYEPHDRSFLVNDGDPDLIPIRISLPDPPKLELIEGYGLPPEEQRFKRVEMPLKLQQLQRKIIDTLNKRANDNRQFIITYYNFSLEFWETLDDNRDYYEKEIDFIKRMWWHRINGYWFFNRGKPTFITGWHFMYLNFWHMPDVKGGYPEYRERDKDEFYFHYYAYTTTETFARLDERGWAIPNDDGSYDMIDLERRVCYGLGQPKNRRSGNTNKGLSNIMEICTRTIGTDGVGVMSYTGENAKKHYKGKVMPAWDEYPLFFRPYSLSKARPKSLIFNTPSNDFVNKGLGNSFTYAETSNAKFYDGTKLMGVLEDECGKCFIINTMVRMYDGSVKAIQDIVVGDQLMGDDSDPRNVLSLGRGNGQCYMIHPKKGEPWGCNDEHILSLYCCSDLRDYNMGYFNVRLKSYLNIPNKADKRHMMLYRVSIKYSEKDVLIEPYYLGIWLGDGSKSSSIIYNLDKEVIDYVEDFSERMGGRFAEKDYNDGRMASLTTRFADGNTGQNPIINAFREYGIFENKHIPYEYLHNSEEVRLQLLAGLIDSDGHACTGKNKQQYEIVSKIKSLAYGIKELSLGLGFWCHLAEKIATMKREDGTVYRCLVYRIHIYGDLHKIPCKIERKIYKKHSMHPNRRNPQHFGFSVEDIGEQDYYGVVIDGNRKFLLEDCTVVHNTTEIDVDERGRVIANCLSLGNGLYIHGYKYAPSTVEDYTKGGEAFRKQMNQSSFYQRVGASGQTPSGLFRLFKSAEEGLEKKIDSYGYSVRGVIKDYQRAEGFTQTADEYLTGIKDHHKNQDTPESMAAYRSQKKLFPQRWADCWIGDSGEIGFDIEKIDNRMIEIRRMMANGNNPVARGNFEWTSGFGSDVRWDPHEELGRFEVSDLHLGFQNKRIKDLVWDFFDNIEKEAWKPYNPSFGTAGADPIKFKKQAEVKRSYSKSGTSDGGFNVLREYDSLIDGNKPRSEWETENLVCTYRYRPKTDDDFCEDVLKACIWYGVMVYPEMNLAVVYKRFREWGYAGYLKHDIMDDGKMKEEPGTHLHTQSKQEGFSLVRNFIDYHCHKIKHLSFLNECKEITNMDDLQNFDLLASVMCSQLGSRSRHAKVLKSISEATIDIGGLMKMHRY